MIKTPVTVTFARHVWYVTNAEGWSIARFSKQEDANQLASAINAQADVAELIEAAKAVCAIKSEMDEASKGKSIEASLNDFFQNHHKRMMAMFCGIDRMKIAVDAMQVSGPKPENNPTER